MAHDQGKAFLVEMQKDEAAKPQVLATYLAQWSSPTISDVELAWR